MGIVIETCPSDHEIRR